MKIAVACGGTGGHVSPGVATATVLEQRGHEVTLWLGGRRAENETALGWTGAVIREKSAGFQPGLGLRACAAGARMLRSVARCAWRVRRSRPDAMLAMGSYASVGPVLAARAFRVPVVLHEANAVPGRAILFLSRFAECVGVTHEATAASLPKVRAEVTGMPLHSRLRERFDDTEWPPGLFTVLVMGGSQGARRLNQIAAEAVCRMASAGLAFRVLHLAGARDAGPLQARYRQAGVAHRVYAFLPEMGKAYGAADIAVCRAGAATCAELAMCGVPALLVPLPSASRDHQTANARVLALSGGADVVQERALSPERLAQYLSDCRRDGDGLARRRRAIRGAAVPDAAERLAALVERTAKRTGR